MPVDPKVEGSSPFEGTINNTVIDARGRGTVVTFDEGEDQSCLLAGLTLTNGGGTQVYFAGTEALAGLTLTNGGGTQVYFAGTEALAGGAILALDSSPTIRNCRIAGNAAELGGGIYGSNSDMIIEGCSIYKNQASNFHGGGIYVTDGSRPQILSNSIMDNVAGSTGGGFASQDGSSATLVFNKVYNNSAMDGGGIYVANSAKTRLTNNMIYRNRSTGTSSGRLVNGGGGMRLWGAPILCENCVFYDNEAVVEGGAIQCAYTDGAQLINCIFWANDAPVGYNVYLRYDQGGITYPSTMSTSYSDWEGGKTGVEVEPGCTFTWGSGCFEKDPLFADATGGDFHLLSEYGRWDPVNEAWVYDASTSACIDLGDPIYDWTAELWPHGKRINVGAYGGTPEASMSSSGLGNICDFNLDGSVDMVDLGFFLLRAGWFTTC